MRDAPKLSADWSLHWPLSSFFSYLEGSERLQEIALMLDSLAIELSYESKIYECCFF